MNESGHSIRSDTNWRSVTYDKSCVICLPNNSSTSNRTAALCLIHKAFYYIHDLWNYMPYLELELNFHPGLVVETNRLCFQWESNWRRSETAINFAFCATDIPCRVRVIPRLIDIYFMIKRTCLLDKPVFELQQYKKIPIDFIVKEVNDNF